MNILECIVAFFSTVGIFAFGILVGYHEGKNDERERHNRELDRMFQEKKSEDIKNG